VPIRPTPDRIFRNSPLLLSHISLVLRCGLTGYVVSRSKIQNRLVRILLCLVLILLFSPRLSPFIFRRPDVDGISVPLVGIPVYDWNSPSLLSTIS
jgi:hypothetical protein